MVSTYRARFWSYFVHMPATEKTHTENTERSFSVFSVCILQWPALSVVASNFGIEVEAVKTVLNLRLRIVGGQLCSPRYKSPPKRFVIQTNPDFRLRRAGNAAEMHRAIMILLFGAAARARPDRSRRAAQSVVKPRRRGLP